MSYEIIYLSLSLSLIGPGRCWHDTGARQVAGRRRRATTEYATGWPRPKWGAKPTGCATVPDDDESQRANETPAKSVTRAGRVVVCLWAWRAQTFA